MTVEITCKVRGLVSPIPFEKIADNTLGRRYSLSLVLCGDTLSRRLNRAYRKKGYPANVLSFPLSKNEGEIFLNVRKAVREAKVLGISARQRIAHLFVHGCLHLRGRRHGVEMEKLERYTLKKFGFNLGA